MSNVLNSDNSKKSVKQANEAFVKLQKAISIGELRPNQRLVESQIAKMLGMSRTPVREALQQLELKGYLNRLPTRGLVVMDRTPGQIRNIYEIREALETLAIKLVCQRTTEGQLEEAQKYHALSCEAIQHRDYDKFIVFHAAFHDALFAPCKNEQLLSLIPIFRDQFFDKRLARVFTAREWRTTTNQHGQMLKAVRQGNIRLAQNTVRHHLKVVLRVALERL